MFTPAVEKGARSTFEQNRMAGGKRSHEKSYKLMQGCLILALITMSSKGHRAMALLGKFPPYTTASTDLADCNGKSPPITSDLADSGATTAFFTQT